MHFLTISTPSATRSCYKRFWNVNTLQARLPETITQQGFALLLTLKKSSCLVLSTAEPTNDLIKDYREGEDNPGQQQVNAFKPQISQTGQADLILIMPNEREPQLQN